MSILTYLYLQVLHSAIENQDAFSLNSLGPAFGTSSPDMNTMMMMIMMLTGMVILIMVPVMVRRIKMG